MISILEKEALSMSKFCKNCGMQLNPGIKFCSSCGAVVPPPQVEPQPLSTTSAPVAKKQRVMVKKFLIPAIAVVLVLAVGIGLLPKLFRGNYPFNEGMIVEKIIKPDKQTTVGNLKNTGWQLDIPENTFDEDVALTMTVLPETDAVNYQNGAFEFIGTPVKITVGNEENTYLSQPVTVTLQIPKDQRISRENSNDYLAAYYNGESWYYIFPDITKISENYITFETYHFSLFSAVKLTEEEKIKLYTRKMATQIWESEELEKTFSEKVGSVFNETFEKMGISDESVKGKLLRSIAKENDYGALLVATERGDITDFSVKCGEMAANALIKHLSIEDALMENITGKAAALATGLGKGALQLKDGNYTNAAKELSSAFIGYFPAGRAYQATIEVIDAGIAGWKNYELDEAYKNYIKGAGSNSTTVSNDDWALMCATQMRGYLIRLQDEAKNNHCALKGISRKALDKDKELSKSLANQAESNLRKSFEKRLANEKAIKAKELEYSKIIEGFKRDLLLERGTLGFDFDMDIESRLRTLFSARKNILDMFGGEMPVLSSGESAQANLNEAIAMWVTCGPKNRGEFYKWLEEKGYKDKTQPAKGDFAWVLTEILDFENAENWVRANKHPSYEYNHSYSQGSYSVSRTFVGNDTYGQGLAGTLGLKATLTGAPKIIYPDQPVSLNLSFTTTENSVVKLCFTGTVNVTFDQWDLEPGFVTGRAISFANKDGISSFSISTSSDVVSYNETLTAQLGAGSEGDRIALRTGFSMGVPMVTNYVYEWKEVS